MKKSGLRILGVLTTIGLCACSQHNMGTYVITSPAPVLDRIEQRGELVVATAGDTPPLTMTTREGQVIGLDVDLAQHIADAMAVKLNVAPTASKDLLPDLEAGRVDMVISGLTITAKRNRRVAFVGPYVSSGKGLLTRQASLAATEDAHSIDLSKVRLTALIGSTSADFIKKITPRAQFLPAQNYDEAIAMILDGRVDAMVADQPICRYMTTRYADRGLIAAEALLNYEPFGIALPGNDQLFVNLVDNVLASLRQDGTLAFLHHRWFQQSDWWDRVKADAEKK
jgi:polar amino acid transport system substrate-binding protein